MVGIRRSVGRRAVGRWWHGQGGGGVHLELAVGDPRERLRRQAGTPTSGCGNVSDVVAEGARVSDGNAGYVSGARGLVEEVVFVVVLQAEVDYVLVCPTSMSGHLDHLTPPCELKFSLCRPFVFCFWNFCSIVLYWEI